MPVPEKFAPRHHTHEKMSIVPRYGFSLPVVDPDLVVDAKKFGNLCRLINHSDLSSFGMCLLRSSRTVARFVAC